MKYLLISYEYPPMRGGIGQYIKNLADGLLQNGEEVYVFTHNANAEDIIHSIKKPLKQESSRLRKNVDLFFKIAWTLIKIGNKGIICVAATWKDEGMIAFLLRKIFGVKYAVLCHGTEITQYRETRWERVMEKIFSYASVIVPNSRFTAQEVFKIRGIKKEKIIINNPPVKRKGNDETGNYKSDKMANDAELTLLTVARLVERKGHLLILQAVNKIKKDGIRIKYYIVGKGDGESAINKYLKKEKMEDCVVMCGDLSDEEVGSLYRNIDLYITLSLNCNNDVEGFGLSVVEAALYGKPSIVGRGGGVEDAVENGVTGILVESNNVYEIEMALRSAILNKSKLSEMGEKAKQIAENKFTPKNIAKRFIDICAMYL